MTPVTSWDEWEGGALMAGTTDHGTDESISRPRTSSWKYIGPGIVVAATGVGAGDRGAPTWEAFRPPSFF